MQSLSFFFGKIREKISSRDFLKSSVCKIVGDELGMEIKKRDVEIKNTTAFLSIPPAAKSEIVLNKRRLLALLDKTCGIGKITNLV
jgi:hypothetical protein